MQRLLLMALPLLVAGGCLTGCSSNIKTLGLDANAQGTIEGRTYATGTVTADKAEVTWMVDPFALVDGALIALGKSVVGFLAFFESADDEN